MFKLLIMNKTTILLTLLLTPFLIKAQISIDQNDMPSAGDTIRLSSTFEIGTINYEETGDDFTWDFSDLFALSQSVDTFVSIQQTPLVYQLVFFTSANLAQPLTEFDQFPGFQVTDVYGFYKNSTSDYRYVGYGVTLNEIPIPNKFDEPDIIYQFPIEAGNIDSSLSSYAFDIPGLGYSGGWKKRVNHTDGWGTLFTPYGSFQTLRVKSEITQFDSLYIDSLGFGLPVYREFTEYKWLGEGFGLPLCTVSDDGLLPSVSYIDSVRTLFSGMQKFNFNGQVSVYPNPVHNTFYVSLNLKEPSLCVITLYDLRGNIISELFNEELNAGDEIKKFNLQKLSLNTGGYVLKVEANGKVTSRKILVM